MFYLSKDSVWKEIHVILHTVSMNWVKHQIYKRQQYVQIGDLKDFVNMVWNVDMHMVSMNLEITVIMDNIM